MRIFFMGPRKFINQEIQSLWITVACQCISPEVTEGFKKCHTSTVIDETDYKLWNVSQENGNVRSECEELKGTDCGDGDSDTG